MSINGLSGSMPDFSDMRARMQEKIAERFNEGDTDQSGALSLDEFSELHTNAPKRPGGPENIAGGRPPAEEIFAQMDQDSDGQVTLEEFSAMKPPGPPPAPGGNFTSDILEMLLELQERSVELFNEADADESGGLSFDEFLEAGAEQINSPGRPDQAGRAPSLEDMFAQLDQDSDREVTLEEFASARPPRPPAPGSGSERSGNSPFEAMSALLDAQEAGI